MPSIWRLYPHSPFGLVARLSATHKRAQTVSGPPQSPTCSLEVSGSQTDLLTPSYAGPRAPRGGVTRKRRCTYRPSVIYLIVNKLLSLFLSLSLSLEIPKPRESGSVIGADWRRSGPSCVLPKGVPQGQTESGGIVLAAICLATSAQRRCHPQEALYLPTFSHL